VKSEIDQDPRPPRAGPVMTAPRAESALSTEPTERHLANAHDFLQFHVRVRVPDPICRWCDRRWPCDIARWSRQVLRRAGEQGGPADA